MRLVVALVIACVGCVRSSPPEKTAPSATATNGPPRPAPTFAQHDPLAPYPGASELCSRFQLQQDTPLYWRSWTTPDDYDKVSVYYKDRAKALKVDENKEKDRLEVHQGAHRVLMVYPAGKAAAHPQCGKPLDPSAMTVMMLSELRMP